MSTFSSKLVNPLNAVADHMKSAITGHEQTRIADLYLEDRHTARSHTQRGVAGAVSSFHLLEGQG